MAFASIGISRSVIVRPIMRGKTCVGLAVIELRYAVQIARRYSLTEPKLIEKSFSDRRIADPSW